MTTIIELRNAVPRKQEIAFKHPVNWKIKEGENWAVIGENGAGKTLLIDLLTAKYALKSGNLICTDENGNALRISDLVKSVAFRDIYTLTDMQNGYYQQRWNAGDTHEVPVVKTFFANNDDEEWLCYLIRTFSIEDLLEKEINLLSSGELRKFLIVRSLLKKPKILILDNPYIGLDARSRVVLNELFATLSGVDGLQIVLVLSNIGDIPEMVTYVLSIKDKTINAPMSRAEFFENESSNKTIFEKNAEIDWSVLEEENKIDTFTDAVKFKNIHIRYGNRTILNGIDWQVRKGEKWALLGENGSGKTTLLSIVSADNPQAYANDVTLFDRKRGTGESIWDIKKRIGYISPEMHLYYHKNVRCIDIVASGFFDTIGLYIKCTLQQESEALEWMNLFRINHLKDISFLSASSGEQRLVLLARIFVKRPDLLILDEPLHGLDAYNKQHVKTIIEKYCTSDKSLIYVTHYENEIPSVVDKRLVLTKYKGPDDFFSKIK